MSQLTQAEREKIMRLHTEQGVEVWQLAERFGLPARAIHGVLNRRAGRSHEDGGDD
jgi:hypothetical protein